MRKTIVLMPCRRVAGTIATQGAQETYLGALQAADAEAILIPSGSSPGLIEGMMDFAAGLLLPGGEDISPQKGGAFWKESAQSHDVARDELELELVRVARVKRKPILGICRGLQMVNVAYGGGLIADVESANPCALTHMGATPSRSDPDTARSCFGALHHEISVLDGSWLHNVFGEAALKVNSFHHQAVDPKKLGEGLRATAWASDGTIEALEATDMSHFVAAAQWHPEMLHNSGVTLWKTFFQRFVDECRRASLQGN
jgi:putative glutamine amidotransferase